MRDYVSLVSVNNNHEITRVSDPVFWYEYQKSILLALKDEGILSETQYRFAEEQLKKQSHASV